MGLREEIVSQLEFLPDDVPIVIFPDDADLERIFADPIDDFLGIGKDLSFEQIEAEVEYELGEELSQGGMDLKNVFAMPKVCGAIAVVTVALLAVLFAVGQGYYLSSISSRPLHYFHEALRPSGFLGLSLGILGTALIVSSLIYLVRKGMASWTRLGPLRTWMGYHIFAGLIGPALIIFHAALVPYSALGLLAFFSMVVVVGSGVIGRYIYVFFPRSLSGRELEFEVVRKRLIIYRKKLVDFGVSPSLLRIDDLPTKEAPAPWLIPAMIRLFRGDRESRQEFQRLRNMVYANPRLKARADHVVMLVRRLTKERQWLVRYHEFRKLMGAWRFLHRWLAIVMLVAVLFHILINVEFGNLWILGGAD